MIRRAARGGVLTGLALLLGGCALGPFYHPPALEIPAAFRATSVTARQAWPAKDWWRGFGSAQLDTLIGEAEAGSFDIQAAMARVRQADAQVRIAGSPLLPTVSGSGSAGYQYASRQASSSASLQSLASRSRESRSYSTGPAISYELDFWGKLRAAQDSALESDLFSRFDQQTVALTTVASVATTWFTALSLQDRIGVARRNLHDATQILQAIQARLQAGTATALDVAQEAALVDGLRAGIPGLQSQLVQQLNGLGVLVGRPPESIHVTPGTLNALRLPVIAPGLPSAVLLRRPDVAAAEAQLIAANANIAEARAAFFPAVTLSASGGWQSVALASLFGPASLFASASAGVAQTIFDNGLKGGQYAQAQGRYDELLANYRKAVVQAFTDVDNAVDAYRLATEQEALERQAVATAQQAADIARAQLLAGTSDIVTALQAQSTLFSDLDTLAQVRLTRFTALVDLYKALGGGWTRADTAVPSGTYFHGVL